MFSVPLVFLLTIFLHTSAVAQWVPKNQGKPTEKVVVEYEKLVAQGAFLSQDGWKTVRRIFVESTPYPEDGVIHVITTGGVLGEDWNRDNQAQVETKWTDAIGTLDSRLRFKPEDGVCESRPSIFIFNLTFTDKHRDLSPDGKMVETIGVRTWKISSTLKERMATIPQAIAYLKRMRDKTKDPVIKKNVDRSILRLKKLAHPGITASAC